MTRMPLLNAVLRTFTQIYFNNFLNILQNVILRYEKRYVTRWQNFCLNQTIVDSSLTPVVCAQNIGDLLFMYGGKTQFSDGYLNRDSFALSYSRKQSPHTM